MTTVPVSYQALKSRCTSKQIIRAVLHETGKVMSEHEASCHESCILCRAKLELSTGVNGRRACGSISGLRLRFYFLSFVGVL